jgi:hypothetical protein
MLGLLKMSALSAVLSFVAVTAYNQSVAAGPSAVSQKVFTDRILPDGALSASLAAPAGTISVPSRVTVAGPKGDRLVAVVPTNCADQEWPYIAADCLSRDDGRVKPGHVRVITIERREGENTSVLQRVPQTTVAQR